MSNNLKENDHSSVKVKQKLKTMPGLFALQFLPESSKNLYFYCPVMFAFFDPKSSHTFESKGENIKAGRSINFHPSSKYHDQSIYYLVYKSYTEVEQHK